MAAILPMTDQKNAAGVAEEIRSAIQNLKIPNAGNPEGGYQVTVSIGVGTALACHEGAMPIAQGLILSADNALYKAKRNGRNRVSISLVFAPSGLTTAP